MQSRKNNILRACGICCMAAILVILFFIFKQFESSYFADEVSTVKSENITSDTSEKVFYSGTWYSKIPDLLTVLLIGVDQSTNDTAIEDSQQADFLAVMFINSSAKTASVLQINRDTITQIKALDVFGNITSTQTKQIALSHVYGNDETQRCENSVWAVENFLYGISIDYYISFTMDAVPLLNDFVGGVPVLITDDFSDVDSSLIKGEEIILHGDQSLTFVRSRKGMDVQTDENRMARQTEFMKSFFSRVSLCSQKDDNFYLKLFNAICSCSTTNADSVKITELYNTISNDVSLQFHSLTGTYQKSSKYVEFVADENLLKQTVIDLFYMTVEND